MASAPRIRTDPLSFQERSAYKRGRADGLEEGEKAARFGVQLWWLVFGVLIGLALGVVAALAIHRF
jgi:hypothetical protein